MRFWPLYFCLFFARSAFAQWEGDYSLVDEKEGCPEGAAIISQERIIFGGRLSFELTPGVIESREDECFYSTRTEIASSPQALRVTRLTERSECNQKKFDGTTIEELSIEDLTAYYLIKSSNDNGAVEEEVSCRYIRNSDSDHLSTEKN